MKLQITSDTHGFYPPIPKGDLFIHAGDHSSGRGNSAELYRFLEYMSLVPCKHKVFIAGNHDGFVESIGYDRAFSAAKSFGITYLENTFVEIEGYKIWGSPYTPAFFDWYFMYRRGGHVWDIPQCDILVTHGPPYGILDKCPDLTLAGCEDLLTKVQEIKPRLHAFGHIHTQGGKSSLSKDTLFVNASLLNDRYKIAYPIVEIDLI